jgi:hypothetical protein
MTIERARRQALLRADPCFLTAFPFRFVIDFTAVQSTPGRR